MKTLALAILVLAVVAPASPQRTAESAVDPRAVLRTMTGSGVIVDPSGYILTNNHVIENAADVTVRLSDSRKFSKGRRVTDAEALYGAMAMLAPGDSVPVYVRRPGSDERNEDVVLERPRTP